MLRRWRLVPKPLAPSSDASLRYLISEWPTPYYSCTIIDARHFISHLPGIIFLQANSSADGHTYQIRCFALTSPKLLRTV